MSDPITLPDTPKSKEFEELVAAHYQCSQQYVEHNIIEREKKEVLELDVIATSYENDVPEPSLVEAKSGSWGFTDIFKVAGWMQYTDIDDGALAVLKDRDDRHFYEKKAKEVNVEVKFLGGQETMMADRLPDNYDEDDLAVWRYAYWIERNLMGYVKARKKSGRDLKGPVAIEDYYQDVKGGIFFQRRTVEKLRTLYRAYMKYPNLSAKCGTESNGGDFDNEPSSIPKNKYNETFKKCKKNLIQASSFVEHLSRLTVLKTAVDLYLYEQVGDDERGDEILFQLGDFEVSRSDFLPDTFNRGLERLAKHAHFKKYPVFWQWFIFVFGGFILEDYKQREYELLEEKTGVPADEIDNALRAFDILFETANGWMKRAPSTRLHILKIFPIPFRGNGVNYRRAKYLGEDATISDFDVKGWYTKSDMQKWHNLAYKMLSI